MKSGVPKQLLRAYRRTDYVVEPFGRGKGLRFVLRIGVRSSEFELFLEDSASSSRTWAMITAYNPRSKKTPAAVNRNAHRRLKRALLRVAPHVFSGFSEAPDGSWREPMWLAVGISRRNAVAQGRAFDQYAIVFGELGGAPRLIECR